MRLYPLLRKSLSSGKIEEIMSPVQSGSNRILKLMGRKYTIEEWKNCLTKINTEFPKIKLSTHFMVGFPTETEEDFDQTKKLLSPPPFFDDITVFKYSSRPTVASRLLGNQISEGTKKLRRKELLKLYAQKYFHVK